MPTNNQIQFNDEPNSVIAEQSVLGAMLISKRARNKACDALTEDSFYNKNNGKLFQVIKELNDKKADIDIPILTTTLKNKGILNEVGGVEYLTELFTTVPTAANIESYIKIVEDKALLRRLIEVSTDISKNASNNDADINATIDEAERKILSVVKNRRSAEFRDIREVLQNTKNNLLQLADKDLEATGILTGWNKIDKLTTGLHEGELIIIAARPAVGKSAFALNLATNSAIRYGKTVGIFNLEMSGESLASRMIGCEGHIDGYKLATGRMQKDDWNRFNEACGALSKTNILLNDTAGITIGEIRSICRKQANSEQGLDLVIIDYLQLITSGGNYGGNRQQEVSDISRSLKLLALELKVPVIALAQLSRASEQRKDRPMLSDLRESGAIEQDADIVAFLYREDYHKQMNEKNDGTQPANTVSDHEPSDTEFIIAKHRNGATGTVHLAFTKEWSSFEELNTEGKEVHNE